jgi:AraC family transcriptional regulator
MKMAAPMAGTALECLIARGLAHSPREHSMALTSEPTKPGDSGGLSHRAFIRAQRYMDAQIGEPMRLSDIARAAHLSRSHFARAFRESTGLSVMIYLRRLRIEKAKAMLIESDASIAAVSATLGFSHHSHFTRLFRKEVGMCPRAFVHTYGLPGQEQNLGA